MDPDAVDTAMPSAASAADDAKWRHIAELSTHVSSLSVARSRCSSFAKLLGYHYYSYALHLNLGLQQPAVIVLTNFPEPVASAFDERQWGITDPAFIKAITADCPLPWTEVATLSPAAAALSAYADRHGFIRGITIPFHNGLGDQITFSVSGDKQSHHEGDIDPSRTMAFVWAFVSRISPAVKEHIGSELALFAPTLTPRQCQILTMLAEGLSNKVIAYRLGVHNRTVEYTIRTATERLGTRTREQAIAKAMAFFLIAPDLHSCPTKIFRNPFPQYL